MRHLMQGNRQQSLAECGKVLLEAFRLRGRPPVQIRRGHRFEKLQIPAPEFDMPA
jgi:hypothetical protein